MYSLPNWRHPAQFPFCASLCRQVAVITEVKRSQGGGHSGLQYVNRVQVPPPSAVRVDRTGLKVTGWRSQWPPYISSVQVPPSAVGSTVQCRKVQ